jgi:hypothetical protein
MVAVAACNASLGVFSSSSLVERYQSDGFRALYFNDQGASAYNLLLKPDVTAADFVTVSGAGGFPKR